MGRHTRAKAKRRKVEEAGEERLDPVTVSRLPDIPDDILRHIFSLLPDGRCARDLSRECRRWWCSTPLSLDLLPIQQQHRISVSEISSILEEHPGPGRRFCINLARFSASACEINAGILDVWLQSRALHKLQELKLDLDLGYGQPPPPLPASVQRFWSTLRVASFTDCSFPGGNSTSSLQLRLLKQLSLSRVSVSDIDLHALLAACPVLQSLLLDCITGCSQVRIESHSLRSIGVGSGHPGDLVLQEFFVKHAPCLSRLFFLGGELTISVTSETELEILGPLYAGQPHYRPAINFGKTVLQGPSIHNLDVKMHSVKILAIKDGNLSLDVVIDIMRCFPFLEKLFIEANGARKKNEKFTNTTNIDHLKKIVVRNYRGNNSHVNFAKFFLKYAKGLESMRLELEPRIKDLSREWEEEQHRLLDINNSASRNARLDFVTATNVTESLKERVHDLSTADPFGIY
uniref:Uncharacterized protein n=1 Tax=Arundo donax TaxID=35708 RepID=A0A0A8XN23_ARUDO